MDYKLPVYRVALVREGDMFYQENKIRNSGITTTKESEIY